MKKIVILRMMLCILGMATMVAFLGCLSNDNQDDILRGQMIPAEFVYGGKTYKNTGEPIAIEKIGATTEKPDNVTYISSVSYYGVNYDIYSIEGLDENEAIAIKLVLAGKTGGFYYYFQYKRQ